MESGIRIGAAGPFARAFSYIGFRVMILMSKHTRAHGLAVHDLGADGRTELLFEKVSKAIDLIRQESSARLNRIRRRTPRVLLLDLGGSYGWYWHDLKGCFLDTAYVAAADPESIAMTIVHEAAHARIRQCGIRSGSHSKERIERACTAVELAFARKAGFQPALLADAERRLDGVVPG